MSLYSYDPETHTATCRTCWISEGRLLPEQAGHWHASHQARCAGAPGQRPTAAVLPFRCPEGNDDAQAIDEGDEPR
ncbi:hypothetical protein [Streptomyces chartreusis]|uniref:hypothetical protein n=1 Tax=Streptomyces chartreusis TaxID=1969 RepID=UPI0037F4E6EA